MAPFSSFDSLLIKVIEQYKQIKLPKLYHILTGKRTAFVLFDVASHQADAYFGILPKLKRSDLEHRMTALVKQKLLYQAKDEMYTLAQPFQEGKHLIYSLFSIASLDLSLITTKALHELRLGFQLLMQVVSYRQHHTPLIQPCTEHVLVQKKCKTWLQQQETPTVLYKTLVEELYKLCLQQPDFYNIVLLSSLSNHQFSGLTSQQVVQWFNVPNDTYAVLAPIIWKSFFATIWSRKKEYPNLHNWLTWQLRHTFLATTSAHETFLLFQKGYSLDQIAHKRRLKQSTINEHIIEIALVMPNFPFTSLLKQESITLHQPLLHMNFTAFKEQHDSKTIDLFLWFRLAQIRELKRR